MKLREFITYKFNDGTLDMYESAKHIVHQPFNPETGSPFANVDAALAWAIKYYPQYFV